MRCTLIAIGSLISVAQLSAQAISTVGAERETRRDRWWRIAYDNDFFTATDRYFTQGIVVEVVTPALGRLPTRRLLIAPRGSVAR